MQIAECAPKTLKVTLSSVQVAEGAPGTLKVTAATTEGAEVTDEYNTVLLAIGRDPCTTDIGIERTGVQLAK